MPDYLNNKNTKEYKDRISEKKYHEKNSEFNERKERPQRPSDIVLMENVLSRPKNNDDN